MRKRSWIPDISIAFLAQLGAVMVSCGSSDIDQGMSAGSGSGGDGAMSGSGGSGGLETAAGGSGGTGGARYAGDGGTGGTTSGGAAAGGSGGNPGRELCGIALVGECVDGVVQVMVGSQCALWTVECPGQCREKLEDLPDFWELGSNGSLQYAVELICEPDEGPGGAAGAGSSP